MERLEQYRDSIKQLIEKYSSRPYRYGDVEWQKIMDDDHDHYQLLLAGWQNDLRQYGIVIHMNIKPDGKIWIQYDGTEDGVANELVDLGVLKSDIVLAYKSEYMRQYTDFAVN